MTLQPTIFIGVGTTGLEVVSRIEREVYAASGDPTLCGCFRYFSVETNTVSLPTGLARMPSTIKLFLMNNGIESAKNAKYAASTAALAATYGPNSPAAFVNASTFVTPGTGAGHRRSVGHLLFDGALVSSGASANGMASMMRSMSAAIDELTAPGFADSTNAEIAKTSGWPAIQYINPKALKLNFVFILTGTGGTGSGCGLRVAEEVRELLRSKFTATAPPLPIKRTGVVFLPPHDHASTHADPQGVAQAHNAANLLGDIFLPYRSAAGLTGRIPGAPHLDPWFDATVVFSPELASSPLTAGGGAQVTAVDVMVEYAAQSCVRMAFVDTFGDLCDFSTAAEKVNAVGLALNQYPLVQVIEQVTFDRIRSVIAAWTEPTIAAAEDAPDLTQVVVGGAVAGIDAIFRKALGASSRGAWGARALAQEAALQLLLNELTRSGAPQVEAEVQRALGSTIAAMLGRGASFGDVREALERLMESLEYEREFNWSADNLTSSSSRVLASFGEMRRLLMKALGLEEVWHEEAGTDLLNCALGSPAIFGALRGSADAAYQGTRAIIDALVNEATKLQAKEPFEYADVKLKYSGPRAKFDAETSEVTRLVGPPQLTPLDPSLVNADGAEGATFQDYPIPAELAFWYGHSMPHAFVGTGAHVLGGASHHEAFTILIGNISRECWRSVRATVQTLPFANNLKAALGVPPPAIRPHTLGVPAGERPRLWKTPYPVGRHAPTPDPMFAFSNGEMRIWTGYRPEALELSHRLNAGADAFLASNWGELGFPYDTPSAVFHMAHEWAYRVAALIVIASNCVPVGNNVTVTAIGQPFLPWLTVNGGFISILGADFPVTFGVSGLRSALVAHLTKFPPGLRHQIQALKRTWEQLRPLGDANTAAAPSVLHAAADSAWRRFGTQSAALLQLLDASPGTKTQEEFVEDVVKLILVGQ